MPRSLPRLATFLLPLAVPAAARAQLELPRASPAARAALTVGVTDVEVSWHRPAVRGRTVWGEVVPYGEVWRAGANDATTIRFEHDVTVEGKPVPAGTYAFFAIPEEDQWTLILNQRAKQWGSYGYDAKQDLLRWQAKPAACAPTEWLSFAVDPVDADSARVALRWGTLEVAFAVDVDVDRIVLAEIDRAVAAAPADDWETRLAAAHHYHEHGLSPEKALAWVDESIRIREHFWNLELKAKLLRAQQRDAEAVALLEKAIALADGKAPKGYVEGLAKQLAEARAGAR